jgi:hypothetical protein
MQRHPETVASIIAWHIVFAEAQQREAFFGGSVGLLFLPPRAGDDVQLFVVVVFPHVVAATLDVVVDSKK